MSMGRKRFSADFQLLFRLIKLVLFVGFVVILILMFVLLGLTVDDIFASLLGFLPTGWALVMVRNNTKMYIFSYLYGHKLKGVG